MMRGEVSHVCGGETPGVDDRRPQGHDEGDERRQLSLQTTRCADADEGPHQESEIEAADVYEEPFQDVRVPTQMRAPQAAGLVEMRIRALQSFASATLQRPPSRATNASTIRIHGVAG